MDQGARLELALNNQYSVLVDNNEKIKANHVSLVVRLGSVDWEVELIIQAAIGFDKTLNELQDDIQTVKQRQAAAAVLSVCQLLIFLVYLGTIGINYLVRCFKVQQAKQLEQNLQEMEERLRERKKTRGSLQSNLQRNSSFDQFKIASVSSLTELE